MTNKTDRPCPECRWIFTTLAIWGILYVALRFYFEANPGLPPGLRLGLALAPTPVFALFLWLVIRKLQSSDELERRIQLEALAVAFPLCILLISTLGLVQRAVELKFDDWSYNHIWPFFVLFYVLGLALARKRYS